MAEFNAYSAFNIDDLDLNFFVRDFDYDEFNDDLNVKWEDAYHLVSLSGDALSLYGEAFAYNGSNEMVNGTVQAMSQWTPDGVGSWIELFHAAGFSIPMQDFFDAAQTFTVSDDIALLKIAFGGDDTIEMSTGKDNIRGFGGADTINGNGGGDRLVGDSGADVIKGGSGRDKVFGGNHNDRLYGGTQADKLYGNKGTDKLYGGGGDDFLQGGKGKDRLQGGTGEDTFDFNTGDNNDKIVDFDAVGAKHDTIDLRGLASVKSWFDLTHNHMSQVGTDVVIDGRNGDVLTLLDVDLADLGKSDFIF